MIVFPLNYVPHDVSHDPCTVQFGNYDMLEQTQEKKHIAILVHTYRVQIFVMSNGF